VSSALQSRVAPILHLSNLDEEESFSPELAHALLSSQEAQGRLIASLLDTAAQEGFLGVDVDFESIYSQDSQEYAQFLGRLRQALGSRQLPLMAALAPKTSAEQPGRQYEGHDYHLIAQNVDFALLMTYDWGWAGGPPMAVAPLPQVRQVVEYALTEFSPQALYLGIPNYGYNWTLPFREGSRAVSLDNVEAVRLAWTRRPSRPFSTIPTPGEPPTRSGSRTAGPSRPSWSWPRSTASGGWATGTWTAPSPRTGCCSMGRQISGTGCRGPLPQAFALWYNNGEAVMILPFAL